MVKGRAWRPAPGARQKQSRQRLQFVYQASESFVLVNQSHYLDQIKTDYGFAKITGVELTLLDCARYFHKAAGINGVAQIAKDIGAKADPHLLARIAVAYENSSVRRLGYLLDIAGHEHQANGLLSFVKRAKSTVPLDPSVKPLVGALTGFYEKSSKWKLAINEPVEIDF